MKGREWISNGHAEEVAAFPPYSVEMDGNHYDLRTARKKSNELP